MYTRLIYKTILERLNEERRFIQVLYGPRQVGKTTLMYQVMEQFAKQSHYATADNPTLNDTTWIIQQWNVARLLAKQQQRAILVLDEIQKIPNWSAVVKQLWDEDSRNNINLYVVVLGSAPLLIQKGLSESLAGRFEIIYLPHWSFREMQEAFEFDLSQYIYFGGYPGAAALFNDEKRWRQYLTDSLIETTLSKDIFLMTRVDKPVLLRRLFELGCRYSGQILSYQKMVGQLQDAGNTSTLSHYLELLSGAGMLTGLQKHASQLVRKRSSSPKFQVMNTGLMSAQSEYTFEKARLSLEYWGRLVESAIGAHLVNQAIGNKQIEVCYWRHVNREVDFVVSINKKLIAIEVKSSKVKKALSGMKVFDDEFHPEKLLLVGDGGIPVEQFLSMSIDEFQPLFCKKSRTFYHHIPIKIFLIQQRKPFFDNAGIIAPPAQTHFILENSLKLLNITKTFMMAKRLAQCRIYFSGRCFLSHDSMNCRIFMSWIEKLLPSISRKSRKKEIPEGVWCKCEKCDAVLYRAELVRNSFVCPKCDYHLYWAARKRLTDFLDRGTTKEIAENIEPIDWVKFRDLKKYKDRLSTAQKMTHEKDALVVFAGELLELPIVSCAFEYKFIGGSMGSAVGERFVQAVNHAIKEHRPLVCFSASGGARMQEAIISLLQMAKTSAALAKLDKKGLPFISVLTNPTMGGVSASLATLGDVIIAEPGALIGFSGPRVIEQTIREQLPEGFQRSDFLLEHGAVDMIIDRRDLRMRIHGLLEKLMRRNPKAKIRLLADSHETP